MKGKGKSGGSTKKLVKDMAPHAIGAKPQMRPNFKYASDGKMPYGAKRTHSKKQG